MDCFGLERALAPFARMNYRFTLNISNDLANNTFERREADLEGGSTAWSAIPIKSLKVGFLIASPRNIFSRVKDYADKAPK